MQWDFNGRLFYHTQTKLSIAKLVPSIYIVKFDTDRNCFFLEKGQSNFEFGYKLYDIDKPLVDRVVKTFCSLKKNMGVFLYGLKGTGKSVAAKMICNRLDLPVLLVTKAFPNFSLFLNNIDQDIIVFIDEFEKIYDDKNSTELLSVMDGSVETFSYKKLFLLTSNSLKINDALINRPGRIRYRKEYTDLPRAAIEEIVDDLLIHKDHRSAVISFISTLAMITVDLVKSIVDEVNVHNEPPENFSGVFNTYCKLPSYKIRCKNIKTSRYADYFETPNILPGPTGYDESVIGKEFCLKLEFGIIKKVLGPFKLLCASERGDDYEVELFYISPVHRSFA